MLLPAGHKLRLRSTADAEATSAALDVRHVCQGREITLQEPAELRRPGATAASPEARAVVREWEKLRRRQVTETGLFAMPEPMLPLAGAIDRLKAAA